MNRASKLLLTASLAMLAVGIFVSFTPIPLSPVWTIVLPYGVILFGLFLINLTFQKEWAGSDDGGQAKPRSPLQRDSPPPAKDSQGEPTVTPHRPAYG